MGEAWERVPGNGERRLGWMRREERAGMAGGVVTDRAKRMGLRREMSAMIIVRFGFSRPVMR